MYKISNQGKELKKKTTPIISQSNITNTLSRITRREFLVLTAASLSFSMLSGCLRCKKEPTPSVSRFPVIDIHTHIFNAEDMPIKGFIQNVILEDKYPFLNPLLSFLETIIQGIAPGYNTEKKWLNSLYTGRATEHELNSKDEEGIKMLKIKTDKYINDKISKFNSLSIEEQQFIEEIRKEVSKVGNPDRDGWSNLLFISPGTIGLYFKWASLFVKFRYKLALKLISTYSKNNGSVALYTPALLDYDKWLTGKDANVRVDLQMDLMEKTSKLLFKQGKKSIHPYMAFDPGRSVMQNNEPRDWVVTSIKEQGAIGVKLYPPMGFRAINNKGLYFHISSDPDFGNKIDEELLWLYRYCIKREIPIIAHCNNTLYSRHTEYEGRAHPKWWEKLLQINNGEFRNLRINLSHFEGSPDPDNEWTNTIGKLMCDYPNVYADVGHHETVLEKKNRKKYFNDLKAFLNKFSNGADKRLMYGSDWTMIARKSKNAKYLKYYVKGFNKYFQQPIIDDFFGGNAARFLFGQNTENKNRKRVINFYKKVSLELGYPVTKFPDWFKKLEQ